MNNEEFERKAEFILNQQAQFFAAIQRLEEAHARMEEAHARLQEDHARTEHSLNDLAKLITDGFKVVIDSFQNLNSKFVVLVDAQIRTDDTVRNLAIALNRHLIEGHTGT